MNILSPEDLNSFARIALIIIGSIIVVAVLLLLFQWYAWLFQVGRFKLSEEEKTLRIKIKNDAAHREGGIRFLIGVFFGKIITEFRHLLALMVFLLYAGTLIYFIRLSDGLEDKLKSIQAVVATLGSVIATILGYYFGEVRSRRNNSQNRATNTEPVQKPLSNNKGIEELSDDV